jgi:hypothetical protein
MSLTYSKLEYRHTARFSQDVFLKKVVELEHSVLGDNFSIELHVIMGDAFLTNQKNIILLTSLLFK